MQVVYSDAHLGHDPQLYFRGGTFHDHPEKPERAERIVTALRAAGHDILPPVEHGAAPRAAIHTPEYLGFLETIHERWTASGQGADEVIPNIHPGRNMAGRPTGVLGQVGWHTADLSSPIGAGTWRAACASADIALTATGLVLDGAPHAYALSRPPGHHAFADSTGGFCFLNNIAIAAQHATGRGRRPAIVDIDVHHGNGTQGIFWRRADVLTVSLHCDPADFYPFFAGYGAERGEGPGAGYNANFPLPPGTGDNAFLDALGEALDAVRRFAPDILFVALGLDAYENDPFAGFRISTPGFARIARALGETGLPTVLVQEGGYNREDLPKNITSFLDGFLAGAAEVV